MQVEEKEEVQSNENFVPLCLLWEENVTFVFYIICIDYENS